MNNKLPPAAVYQPSTSQPTIVLQPNNAVALGPNSQYLTCPHCHAKIYTRVESDASTKTHIMALLLCGFCCCCIPYCNDSCMSQKHYCPSCKSYLGQYEN